MLNNTIYTTGFAVKRHGGALVNYDRSSQDVMEAGVAEAEVFEF